MRQIKFRAWDKRDKHMLSQTFYKGSLGKQTHLEWMSGDGCGYAIEFKDAFCLEDTLELMQFTGLHDKNGKEIYEGDIISAEWIDPNNGYTTTMIQQVRDISISNGYWEIYNPERTAKIIGNIYENPELL